MTLQTVAASLPMPGGTRPLVLLIRRPLLTAFVLGCAVSVLASGRFTPRLIVDGILGFAFVPLCEMLGFAVVYRTGRRPVPFAAALDTFFAGNGPQFWWMWSIVAVALVRPPERQGLLPLMLATVMVPIVAGAVFDFRFSRRVLERGSRRSALDVVLFRAVAWSTGLVCFLGVAIKARDVLYTFVEIWQTLDVWVHGVS